MADLTPDVTFARIDRALARIEAAAARRATPSGSDPAVEHRHARLRASVARAIAALDTVIADEDAD